MSDTPQRSAKLKQRTKITPRPERQPFVAKLNAEMAMNGFTQSDLARKVWGTRKDKRGYDVARNRDRIGHYLKGTSYPNPETLRKIAAALSISVAELAIERKSPSPVATALVSANGDATSAAGQWLVENTWLAKGILGEAPMPERHELLRQALVMFEARRRT